MKKVQILLTALITLATFQFATAQTATPDSVTANFLHNATVSNLKEIKTGQLAARKGKSLSVKAYGTKMITDHTKANTKLSTLVKKKGYTIPAPTSPELATDPMLANATGATFDKNYVAMMIVDHQNAIKIFENASLNSSDADVKAFATQTLPVLRQHLASIQSIAANMGVSVQ